jgi:mRNA interferase RelE/StbE
LADNPRPPKSKKLTARDSWRIRIGNYRVIYLIEDDNLIVIVIEIGHRKEVYK